MLDVGNYLNFFQERKEAVSLFTGKKGLKLREQVVKKSKALPDEMEDRPRVLPSEDAKKIQVIFHSSFL